MPSARTAKFVEDSAPGDSTDTVNGFTPSPYQVKILNWFKGERNKQHLIVRARAGTSKTSTLIAAVKHAPESNILVCAFTKIIADELKDRLDNPRAKAQTLHSLGFQALREHGGYAYSKMADPKWKRERALADSTGMPFAAKKLVGKLITKARELTPVGATVGSLIDLAQDFNLDPPEGSFYTTKDIAAATLRALEVAKQPPTTGVDYADMMYLPLVMGWLKPQFDMVVVDELQDFTLSQLRMALAVLKPYGAFVGLGDDRQNVFGFRGSCHDGLDRMKKELDAEELPLSMTYRCPKSVVALAQKYVPDFEVAETAPEGIVDSVREITDIVRLAAPGDFVLSRTNAPLAKVAMALLRAKKRAKIRGRDIGEGLRKLVEQLAAGKDVNTVCNFLTALTRWEEREVARLQKLEQDERVPAIEDKAATLRALAVGAEQVDHINDRIDYLFSDHGEESVYCSTVHRAKGLESNRVFVLRSTFFGFVACECGHRHKKAQCSKCSCKAYVKDEAAAQEERNLAYVAATRSKHHLTYLDEII